MWTAYGENMCALPYSVHKRALLQYIEFKVLLNPIYPRAFIEFIFNLLKLKALSSAKHEGSGRLRIYFPKEGKFELQRRGRWLIGVIWESSKFKHKQETDFASFIGSFCNIISHTKWVLRKFNLISQIPIPNCLFLFFLWWEFSAKVNYLCLSEMINLTVNTNTLESKKAVNHSQALFDCSSFDFMSDSNERDWKITRNSGTASVRVKLHNRICFVKRIIIKNEEL